MVIANIFSQHRSLSTLSRRNHSDNPILDFQRIQQIVHRVNAQQDYYQEQLLAVQKVNEAVIDSNEELVFSSLNNKILNLPELDPQVRNIRQVLF